ncbi:MerR family transcriptional regulator, partial [Bacillus thuringiensis]|nr:MerR family transcriptional regulator [Bacillus thuringiensis]
MQINFKNLTINIFTKTTKINIKTIQFYQHKNLLPKPNKPYNNIHHYNKTNITQIQ